MGQVTGALRTFLRFLAVTGEGPAGLDAQIESPRIYRGERLPRALAWETVRTFLRSIDRTTSKGRRDYAMFVLIATYGLRASEVRTLDLDDVGWRSRQIRVPRPKVGTPLLLPLTDEVGTTLLDYLRYGRPASTAAASFSASSSPSVLSGWALSGTRSVRGRGAPGSSPARGGPHSLRHALALHLLREGAALKTIGDLLGHRSAESTGSLPPPQCRRPARRGAAASRGRRGRRGAAMSPPVLFTSSIGPVIARYVAFKQALGRRYRNAAVPPPSVRPLPGRAATPGPDRRDLLRVVLIDQAPDVQRTPQGHAACPPVLSLPAAEQTPLFRSRPEPVPTAAAEAPSARLLRGRDRPAPSRGRRAAPAGGPRRFTERSRDSPSSCSTRRVFAAARSFT